MTNPIYWPGTTIVRSTCNAFSLSDATRIDTRKALIGRPPADGSKVERLVAQLKTGPKTSLEMGTATGIPAHAVAAFLKTVLKNRTVVVHQMKKPRVYALPKAGA